jgi:uncharacterized protein
LTDPVSTEDTAKPSRRTPPLRQCAVTRAELPAEDMIRFVAGLDGAIAPDITGKMGGRGVWVTATRTAIEQAVKRNVFAKSLKMQAKPPQDLADLVERQLLERVRQSLAFANKGGVVTTGFTKVEKAIEQGKVAMLLEASDAAPDGADKLRRKFIAIATAANRPAMLSTALNIADLSLATGRPLVVHAALAEGGQCRAFQKECRRLDRFKPNDVSDGDLERDVPMNSGSTDQDMDTGADNVSKQAT